MQKNRSAVLNKNVAMSKNIVLKNKKVNIRANIQKNWYISYLQND